MTKNLEIEESPTKSKTIEKFLAYSDEKLEELAEENQKLREENHQSTKKE